MGFAIVLLRFLVIALYIALIARVVMSWVAPRFDGQVGRLVYQTTEPFLAPIRSVLPRTGMIDLSPMVAFLILTVIAAAVGLR